MSNLNSDGKIRKLVLDIHEFRMECKKLDAKGEEIENRLIEFIGEDLKSGVVHDPRPVAEPQ